MAIVRCGLPADVFIKLMPATMLAYIRFVMSLAGTFGGGRQSQSCFICGAVDITVPYTALPCQHRFCYYCLRANTLSAPGYKCPQCGLRITGMKRWRLQG